MTETNESLHFLDYWRVIRSRKEIVIVVFLLVVLTGVLITYSMPKVFMSSTLIRVKEDTQDITSIGLDRYRSRDPLFLRTQFEIIQSRPIREDVVRRLNLNEVLGKAYGYYVSGQEKSMEQTIRLLGRATKVQQYRETNLIQIRVSLSEPKGAVPEVVKNVADEIARAYRDQDIERNRLIAEGSLTAMRKSIEEQNVKVIAAEANREEIRKKYNITITGPNVGAGTSIDKRTLEQLEYMTTVTRSEVAQKKALISTITNLPPNKLLEAQPRLAPDQGLEQLVADKRRAEVEFEKLKASGLGENHDSVKGLKQAIEELNAKIKSALEGWITGIQADCNASVSKLDALEANLKAKKDSEIQAEGKGYREFEKADDDLEQAKKIRDAVKVKYETERMSLDMPRSTVEIIEPAKAPDKDDWVSPDFTLNIILSIVVGIVAGIGLAYFIEYLDTSVKTIEDIEKLMGVSVLGVIPQKVRSFVDEAADASHKEAYRVLRTNIQFSKKLSGAKTLCVTSGSVGEGKSLTIFNLSYVYAQLGGRILIVDSDLHRPRQHKILGVSNNVGLANVLAGDVDIGNAIFSTKVPNLYFIPSGRLSSGVQGLLDNRRLKELIAELREAYDMVFFDAPPIIGVSDASLLVREVEGTLLVIQHRKYPRSVSCRAKDMIENVGGNIVGVVLNNINISRDYSYYYHHYYSYPKYGEQAKTDKK